MSKYTELITNYHATKPRFFDSVDLATRHFVDSAATVQGLVEAFDIDSATGAQLDILGQWIGRSRYVKEPIKDIYFSWDDDGPGYDRGVWQGPFDPDDGFTALSDDTYRVILRAKIAINQWDGQNDSLPAILDAATAGSGLGMQIIDHQDMTVSMLIFPETTLESVSLELIAAIRMGYLTVKAAGVWSGDILVPSVGTRFFGFDMENQYIVGFDDGAWGKNL
ncbi:DUF2612 domain-containing protein [Cronobacter turicensis]